MHSIYSKFIKRLRKATMGKALRRDLERYEKAADALDCAVKEMLEK